MFNLELLACANNLIYKGKSKDGIDDLSSENEGKQAKNENVPSSMSFYEDCFQKLWPRFKDGLLTSDDPDLGCLK